MAKNIKHKKKIDKSKIRTLPEMEQIQEIERHETEIQEVDKVEENKEVVTSYKGIDGINADGKTPKPIPGIEKSHQELIVQILSFPETFFTGASTVFAAVTADVLGKSTSIWATSCVMVMEIG